MKKEISALDLHYVIQELQFLVGGKIDKIQQPKKKQIWIIIHVSSKGKQILKIDVDKKYLCLTNQKTTGMKGFTQQLRKNLGNARIQKIQQKNFERILDIELTTKEKTYNLICEFFDKGNMLLLKGNKIIGVEEQQKWTNRTVKPGLEYEFPKKDYDFLKITEKQLQEMIQKTKQGTIIKALAIDLGLGGTYAEEICLIADTEKDEKPVKVDTKKIFTAIKELRNKKIEPVNYTDKGKIKETTAFPLKKYEKIESKSFKTFNEAIDRATEEEIEEIPKEQLKEIEKIKRILEQQQKTIEKLEKQIKEEQKKGETIYENYQVVDDILKQIKEARKKLSLKEMKEKLKGNKIIKSLTEKEVLVEI